MLIIYYHPILKVDTSLDSQGLQMIVDYHMLSLVNSIYKYQISSTTKPELYSKLIYILLLWRLLFIIRLATGKIFAQKLLANISEAAYLLW